MSPINKYIFKKCDKSNAIWGDFAADDDVLG